MIDIFYDSVHSLHQKCGMSPVTMHATIVHTLADCHWFNYTGRLNSTVLSGWFGRC